MVFLMQDVEPGDAVSKPMEPLSSKQARRPSVAVAQATCFF
jgi:hypothetical protein